MHKETKYAPGFLCYFEIKDIQHCNTTYMILTKKLYLKLFVNMISNKGLSLIFNLSHENDVE